MRGGDDAMAELNKENLPVSIIVAGLFCLIALIVLVATATVPNEAQNRWADYYKSYHNVGGAALVAGVLWLAFAVLRAKTDFFAVDRKIGSDELSISVASLIIAIVVALYLALSNLPAFAPAPEVQIDAAERVKLARWDKGLRILVWSVVLCTGFLVASFPLRRYFRL